MKDNDGNFSEKLATDPQNNIISRPTTPAIYNIDNTIPIESQTIDYKKEARNWFRNGYSVIPIMPRTKQPAVSWDPWFDNLDEQKIEKYWDENPGYEIGCIVGDETIVLDADTPESEAAIAELEFRFNVSSNLVVKTKKGKHFFYKRSIYTSAKSDSHSTEKYPARIDVKTGRALAILPPSTGKVLISNALVNRDELSEVRQPFIDAVYHHNGRPRPSQQRETVPQADRKRVPLNKIEQLLNLLDPDCGREDWLHLCMAIYNETGGSEAGMALFDRWSSKGNKYKGKRDIETTWRSFRSDVPNPVTIATLIKMAKDAGADVATIMGGESFAPCKTVVINPKIEENINKVNDTGTDVSARTSESQKITFHIEANSKPTLIENPLEQYFLNNIATLEENAMAQVQILGALVLLGQATVIYAKQNTGKTLLIIFLIIEGIKSGKLDPSKVIYINMDDDSNGLITKARIAEEYGFKMVADGYNGFEAKKFRVAMRQMIETDTAKGKIILLDTLKKFVDTMSKKESSDFAKVVRQFVLKGGTVIALSHANKNPGRDGKTVYSGTTDIIDDFDCGYTLTTVTEDRDKGVKIVEFENIKRRGNVALNVSYSYALEPKISYNELLLTVEGVDPEQVLQHKHKNEKMADGQVIEAVKTCIREDINTKMKLAETAAERAEISKRKALNIIEKYTGTEWNYKVKDRGAKVYMLLDRPSGDQALPPPAINPR